MPCITRRRALQCCAGLLAATAGCNDIDRSAQPTTQPSGGAVGDYETVALRSDGPIVADNRDEDTDGRRSVSALLRSASEDRIRFVADHERADDARAFVEDTRFDDASVFVEQSRVGECYHREVMSASRSGNRFSVEFCEVLRDAGIACEKDASDVQATFVRLPFAFEDAPEGYSLGYGGNCPAAGGEER
ncbi:hypothetical protein [Halostella litorea]|uniref:hypothetical protein n=1 Tax=Halostella litorea TaxID=2528831 RepID=UPI001092A2C4|nr:hypothetical protein [Halostella litorea]